MTITVESQAATEIILIAAGLPVDTQLCVFANRGQLKPRPYSVRHVRGGKRLTWCNQFWHASEVRDTSDVDATLPICKACLRSEYARVAKYGVEEF